MSSHRALRLWRVGAVTITGLIVAVLLMPSQRLPTVAPMGLDKLAHLAAYLLLGVCWHRSGMPVFWVLAFGLLVGAGTEVAQEVMAWGRDASPWDLAANMTGVVVGVGFSLQVWGSSLPPEQGKEGAKEEGAGDAEDQAGER